MPRKPKIVVKEDRTTTLVRMYMEGYPTQDIAEALGTNRNVISAQVAYLRKKGVALPYRRAPNKRIDVDALNDIIGRYR